MLPSISISKQRSVENNVIIAIAFLRFKIARSSKGVSVAILRGKRTMSVRVREKNRKDESVKQRLMAVRHSRMSWRNLVSAALSLSIDCVGVRITVVFLTQRDNVASTSTLQCNGYESKETVDTSDLYDSSNLDFSIQPGPIVNTEAEAIPNSRGLNLEPQTTAFPNSLGQSL